MSGAAGLDLRFPIGGLFALLGLILAGYGIATAGDTSHYAPSGGLNINLWWGLVMLATGLGFLWGGMRGRRASAARPALETAEGRATEEREHRTGLER